MPYSLPCYPLHLSKNHPLHPRACFQTQAVDASASVEVRCYLVAAAVAANFAAVGFAAAGFAVVAAAAVAAAAAARGTVAVEEAEDVEWWRT